MACADISLAQLWDAWPNMFIAKFDPRLRDHKFATTKVEAGWYLVRKTPVPDSLYKSWKAQCQLLTYPDEVPNAGVLAQAVIVHYRETGEYLFDNVYVRVADVDDDGRKIFVGDLNKSGLTVGSSDGENNGGGVGLSSCMRRG